MHNRPATENESTISRLVGQAIYTHKQLMETMRSESGAKSLLADDLAVYRSIRMSLIAQARCIKLERVQEIGLTTNQIAWASSHDWYVSICHLGDKDGVKAFDSTANKIVEFYNFASLREWAGY